MTRASDGVPMTEGGPSTGGETSGFVSPSSSLGLRGPCDRRVRSEIQLAREALESLRRVSCPRLPADGWQAADLREFTKAGPPGATQEAAPTTHLKSIAIGLGLAIERP